VVLKKESSIKIEYFFTYKDIVVIYLIKISIMENDKLTSEKKTEYEFIASYKKISETKSDESDTDSDADSEYDSSEETNECGQPRIFKFINPEGKTLYYTGSPEIAANKALTILLKNSKGGIKLNHDQTQIKLEEVTKEFYEKKIDEKNN